jgi:hypothetical protein
MDYSVLFDQQFTKLGLSFTPVYNCFDGGRLPHTGWSLKLPDFDTDVLLLHFQDLVNIQGGRVLELEAIEQRYGSRADRVVVTYWNHGLRSSILRTYSIG